MNLNRNKRGAILAGAALAPLMALGLASNAAPTRQMQPVEPSPTPPATTICCADGPCREIPENQCKPPEKHDLQTDGLSRALRLTQRRRAVVSGAEFPLDPANATLGDVMAWYFDYSGLKYVARGIIVEEQAYDAFGGGVEGDIWTHCRMQVLETLKGDVTPYIEFETVGGKTNGLRAWSSHHPTCNLGDDALVFVIQGRNRQVVPGPKEMYMVVSNENGEPTADGQAVLDFVRDTLIPGAPL